MTMTPRDGKIRSYAFQMNFWDNTKGEECPADTTVCIVGWDGSVWSDWDRLGEFAALPLVFGDNIQATVLARMIVAARGNLNEVSRERLDEIALEYGAKIPPFGVPNV